MMRVNVHIIRMRQRRVVDVPDGSTVAELCAVLKVPPTTVLAVVDGCHVPGEHILDDGCEVTLVPAISGG